MNDLTFPSGISVTEAQSILRDVGRARTLAPEGVSLDVAFGRILAEDVTAPFDVPGYRNSAMDGFAVRVADLARDGETTLTLRGEILAGGGEPPDVLPNTCMRITTGAPLPKGADTVVMKENTTLQGERVTIQPGTAAGANVRPAGEDYAKGDRALTSGTRLSPAQVSALASFGWTHINVVRRPRAVVITTGDELVAQGEPLSFGQIYDSNRYSLSGLLLQHGAEVIRHERVRDDPAKLADALRRAAADADIIISSGGVSAGEADYLPSILSKMGKVYFWKVRIKPGMPILCGAIGDALLFALPGNPVSGIATFLTFVAPTLRAMSGQPDSQHALFAKLSAPILKRHSRVEFQRARLECSANAELRATALAKQGSGMLRGVADADALIVLPEEAREYLAGEVVPVLPLPGWPS